MPVRSSHVAVLVCLAGGIFAQEPERALSRPDPAPAATALDAPPPLADWRVRRKELFTQMVGLQAIVETLPGTAFDTARNFPREWGRTFGGVGKRFANQYAQFAVGETVEFTVSAIRHEDPRYWRLGSGKVGTRLWHAVRGTFVTVDTRTNTDKIALGRMAGVYGSFAVSQTWSPGSIQGPGQLLIWGSFGMTTKTGVNILREFSPDLRRLFHRKTATDN